MKEEKSRKKGFLARLMEKLDKKMEERAKSKPCCGGDSDSKGSSCCSK
jgi:hypothetical protein